MTFHTQSFLLGMKPIPLTLLALLLTGCSELEWVRNQYQRCYNAGGSGDYSRVTFVFTCWKRTEPPSHRTKLYESRYK